MKITLTNMDNIKVITVHQYITIELRYFNVMYLNNII